MNLDRFTPLMLVIIAVLLAVLALRPIVQPSPVHAQAGAAGTSRTSGS